jgi:hypothetical protein
MTLIEYNASHRNEDVLMYIESKRDGKAPHRHNFDEPTHIPEAGDIYVAEFDFVTAGKVEYKEGDELLIICRTDEAPYGRIASLGNLVVQGIDGEMTIWSNIELAIVEGMISFKKTIFDTESK